jgi:hypothetical protein
MPTMVRVKKLRAPNVGAGVKSGRKTQIRSTTRYSKGHRSSGVGSFKSLKRKVTRAVDKVKGANQKALGVAQKFRGWLEKRAEKHDAKSPQSNQDRQREQKRKQYNDDIKKNVSMARHLRTYTKVQRQGWLNDARALKKRRQNEVGESMKVVARVIGESYEAKKSV